MKPLSVFALVVAAFAVSTGSPVTHAQGQGSAVGRPEWVPAVRHDVSRPLREMLPTPQRSTREDFEVKQEPRAGGPVQADAALQQFPVAPLAAIPGAGCDG